MVLRREGVSRRVRGYPEVEGRKRSWDLRGVREF